MDRIGPAYNPRVPIPSTIEHASLDRRAYGTAFLSEQAGFLTSGLRQ